MTEPTPNQKTTNINNIVLSDRLVLNHIWPNVLAKYWQNYDDGRPERDLYSILKSLNIENIAPVYRNDKGEINKYYDIQNYNPLNLTKEEVTEFKCFSSYVRNKQLAGLTIRKVDSKQIDFLFTSDKRPTIEEHTQLMQNQGDVYAPAGKIDKNSVHILSSVGGEVLVTLTAVDNDVKFITEDLFKPVNGYEHILGRLKVKIPPKDSLYTCPEIANSDKKGLSQAEIIANYQLLGFYFPLSQLFDSYDGGSRHYEDNQKESSIEEKKSAAAERIVKSLSIAITQWWKATHNQNATDKFVNRLRNVLLNLLISQHKKAGEQPNPVGQLFDRGGAQAFDDDFNWQYFVPRMVAYNWNHKWQTAVVRYSQSLQGENTLKKIEKRLESCKENDSDEVNKILEKAGLNKIIADNFENTITNGDQLSSYPEMLATLEYKIIDGLNIFIEYADKLPMDKDGWHPEDYACELEVVLPAPPEIEDIGASAIADFTALRASQPFTVG